LIDQMIAEQADPSAARRWAKAEATAALSGERTCIECRVEFRRLYRDVRGRPRLRSPKEWARSIYCSQSCASAYRSRRRVWLGLHLAGLDAAPPSPERREARPPGRPSKRTGPRVIERTERAATILRMRFAGDYTFREIGDLLGVSPQSIHQLYWRLIKANPPNRRRQRVRERALLTA
jgi:Sigma-70, region 4